MPDTGLRRQLPPLLLLLLADKSQRQREEVCVQRDVLALHAIAIDTSLGIEKQTIERRVQRLALPAQLLGLIFAARQLGHLP